MRERTKVRVVVDSNEKGAEVVETMKALALIKVHIHFWGKEFKMEVQ